MAFVSCIFKSLVIPSGRYDVGCDLAISRTIPIMGGLKKR